MSGNNSDDSTGPALPRGVLKARAGWKGDDMEMEHQRETMMRETDNSKTSVAVDLQQFRNEEVGVGYQAKHVVRQRSEKTPEVKIHDMSTGRASNEDSQSKKKKKRKHEEKSEVKEDPAERVRKYLQSEGLRRFRKELEKIV